MSPADRFRELLAASYADWLMSDPLVTLAACAGCGVEKLCRPVAMFELPKPVPGILSFSQDQMPVSVERPVCLPCYRSLQERLTSAGGGPD